LLGDANAAGLVTTVLEPLGWEDKGFTEERRDVIVQITEEEITKAMKMKSAQFYQ
jgi:hypothetical protein